MNPQQEALLQSIAQDVAETKGAVHEIKESHQRQMDLEREARAAADRALHKRLDGVKKDLETDIVRVEKEAKAPNRKLMGAVGSAGAVGGLTLTQILDWVMGYLKGN